MYLVRAFPACKVAKNKDQDKQRRAVQHNISGTAAIVPQGDALVSLTSRPKTRASRNKNKKDTETPHPTMN